MSSLGDIEVLYSSQLALDPDGSDLLRHQFLNHGSDALVKEPSRSLESEFHVRWWRLGFYKPIEHYRRLSKSRTDRSKWAAARLLQIIDEGLGMTLGMLRALCDKHGVADFDELFLSLGMPVSADAARPAPPELARMLHHLLICLGDLARYKAQSSATFLGQDQFGLACRFYDEARSCLPAHGHACSMLAVIATQLERPLDTVYWYIRSFSCEEPSQMGRENLKKYLDTGLGQKHAKWNIDPLLRLVSAELFSASPAHPGLAEVQEAVATGGLGDAQLLRLQLVLIALGVNLLLVPDSYATAEGQLMALLCNWKGRTLPVVDGPCVVEPLLNDLLGFLPLAPFLDHMEGLLRSEQDTTLARLMRDFSTLPLSKYPSAAADVDMALASTGDELEEVIHFRGFGH